MQKVLSKQQKRSNNPQKGKSGKNDQRIIDQTKRLVWV